MQLLMCMHRIARPNFLVSIFFRYIAVLKSVSVFGRLLCLNAGCCLGRHAAWANDGNLLLVGADGKTTHVTVHTGTDEGRAAHGASAAMSSQARVISHTRNRSGNSTWSQCSHDDERGAVPRDVLSVSGTETNRGMSVTRIQLQNLLHTHAHACMPSQGCPSPTCISTRQCPPGQPSKVYRFSRRLCVCARPRARECLVTAAIAARQACWRSQGS